jgi:ABC-type sugar transport system permease subunit
VALVCIAAMSIWGYIGFYVVIYLAGLGNISKELYEAARMDGANEWQVFRRITLPMLSPTTFFLLIVGTIGAMQAFNQIYVMTGGGPLDTTRTVTMLIFKTFYQQTRVGYGSAMSVVLALIIVALTVVNFRFVGRRVHYD